MGGNQTVLGLSQTGCRKRRWSRSESIRRGDQVLDGAKNHGKTHIPGIIPLHEKFLQFDWLRAVVFQLNLKYLHVKITNLLQVVV